MSLRAFLTTRYVNGFSSRDAVLRHHQRRFEAFRANVMPRSAFYAPFAHTPLHALPPMTKSRLMSYFTDINTCGIAREHAMEVALSAERSRDFSAMIGGVAVGLSTGTSGQRGLFLATPSERRLWAAILAGRFWPHLARRQRVAFFMRADNELYRSISNPLVTFSFFDLLNPFDTHITGLDALKPTVLIAPAQVLRELAHAQNRGDLAIAPSCVISVAETLSGDDEEVISHSFGVKVDQVYQATEGVIALTCPHGSLHLNERWLHVERDVIDPATGAFCPVISDFTRESVPILNYRLDDVLIPHADPCSCGCASQRIARIEGREDDALRWPSPHGRKFVPSEALRTAFARLPVTIRDYRVIQRGAQLEIWLETDGDAEGLRPEMTVALKALAHGLGCLAPEFTLHNGRPKLSGEKRRRIFRDTPDTSMGLARSTGHIGHKKGEFAP